MDNYRILEKIYESENSLVYRALRNSDGQLLILKQLRDQFPSPREISRYQQEFEIIQGFESEFIIKSYAIEKHNKGLALVLEDFGAISLNQRLKNGPIGLEEFLSISIKIANGLEKIHQAKIIHKDINPSNIVVNLEKRGVKIIDFGLASRVPRENPGLKNISQLEGTIAYLSPEQTGRINRKVDYRSDLYSLGITFYEMLTGHLPFQSNDIMELVHSHIAKKAQHIFQQHSEIPPILSKIIMQLLEKNAEDRYQSAHGLKKDLEKCQQYLQQQDELMHCRFQPAEFDGSGQLNIPQKLYGREQEIEQLLMAFTRATQGASEFILVAGYSGVGKTALVHEVHKPMTEKRGHFASGKFDQFQKTIPYSAITQAFNEFCRYLLTEPKTVLQAWKSKILQAVGKNGQIIIDVIPNLEWIIGSQPPVVDLEPAEAQNRFNLLFLHFINALCNEEHPFILFIDDLQWVDSASLSLLMSLLQDKEMSHLLLIGAYRDNEVDASHPLIVAIEKLRQDSRQIHKIKVDNLQHNDLENLLFDTLIAKHADSPDHKAGNTSSEDINNLTQLILQKTLGNAFFTHQFLHTLYDEQLLVFNYEQQQWHWQLEKIVAQNISDNVVDLMAKKIASLPQSTSQILQLAACIGNLFELSTLAIINESNRQEAYQNLHPAVSEGFILPLDDNYKQLDADIQSQFKFLHDRVQQAAYALIDNQQRQAVHLKIARLLKQNAPMETLDEQLFDIVGQYNQSLDLLENSDERLQVAELNLQAGQKAKMAAAYKAASQYLNNGVQLLEPQCWEEHYELIFNLYKQSGECEYLAQNFKRSEYLFTLAIEHASCNLEKAEIYVLQMKHSMAKLDLEQALARGRAGLQLCGIEFPQREQMDEEIQKQSAYLQELIGGREPDALADIPSMRDSEKMLAMRTLSNIALGSYLSGDNRTFTLSTLMSTGLSLQYGQLDISASIYGWYGVLLSTQGQLKESFQFGRLALKMAEKYPQSVEKTQTHNLVGTFLVPISQHLNQSVPVLMQGYHLGMEIGDVLPAVFCFGNLGMLRLAAGQPLNEVLEFIKETIRISYQNKVFSSGDIGCAYEQFILQLMTGEEQYAITDESFEQQQLGRINESNSIAFVNHMRMQRWFWLAEYEQAFQSSHQAEIELVMIPGYFLCFEHVFIKSLTLCQLYERVEPAQQREFLSYIAESVSKLKLWSENCPINFAHRHWLVEAEMARITGDFTRAMQRYDQAIESAKEGNFLQNLALANECAMRFWLAQQKSDFARLYFQQARYFYHKWGAVVSVERLEEQYPFLLEREDVTALKIRAQQTIMSTDGSDLKSSSALDLNSVIKASQTMSGSIVLNQLLENMMSIVVENAGAERGVLLLKKSEEWVIDAEYLLQNEQIEVLQSQALEQCETLPKSVINYVQRTQDTVVLSDAQQDSRFMHDLYFRTESVKSVLLMPLLSQAKLIGALYLENSLIVGAFTQKRLEILKLLSAQMTISIENSTLYNNLEVKVAERTEELQQSLQRLKKAQNHLIEVEKMASLGRLVAGVAHELNTPIGICVTAASFLGKESQNIHTAFTENHLEKGHFIDFLETSIQSAEILSANLERASGMIQNFKQVSVDVSNEAARIFNLMDYLHKILYNLQPALKRTQHKIEIKGDSELKIKSYPGVLSQIITNLVMNSIKHGFKSVPSGQIKISIQSNDEEVELKYTDNGCGMSAEIKKQAFDPFFTTQRNQGGSGLGLFILYNLVTQNLKGRVSCESGIDKGTKFCIRFPRSV